MYKIHQLPFWIKSQILRYYICDLTPSDLINFYAIPEFANQVLAKLSSQEWSQIYWHDNKIISVGENHSLAIRSDKVE